MAFCKFCGKELDGGEVCSCEQAQAENTANTETNEIETVKPESTDGSTAAAKVTVDKTTKIVLAAVAAVVVILFCVIIALLSGGSYKDPVEDLEKAYNKSNGKLLVNTTYTNKMIKKYEKNYDDIEELYEVYDDLLEMFDEDMEDEYGKNVKYTIKIEDKYKLYSDDIEDLEDYYDRYLDTKVKITEGYELECTMKIKGRDDKDEEDFELTVVKIKDEGWKLSYKSFTNLIY